MTHEPVPERRVFWEEDDLLRRLKRIEGQVRGIQAMIGRRDNCREILTQVAAVSGALERVSRIVGACSLVENLNEIADIPDPVIVRGHLKDWLGKI